MNGLKKNFLKKGICYSKKNENIFFLKKNNEKNN